MTRCLGLVATRKRFMAYGDVAIGADFNEVRTLQMYGHQGQRASSQGRSGAKSSDQIQNSQFTNSR
jgi:hypothetical protein